jgi:hypothetical protein
MSLLKKLFVPRITNIEKVVKYIDRKIAKVEDWHPGELPVIYSFPMSHGLGHSYNNKAMDKIMDAFDLRLVALEAHAVDLMDEAYLKEFLETYLPKPRGKVCLETHVPGANPSLDISLDNYPWLNYAFKNSPGILIGAENQQVRDTKDELNFLVWMYRLITEAKDHYDIDELRETCQKNPMYLESYPIQTDFPMNKEEFASFQKRLKQYFGPLFQNCSVKDQLPDFKEEPQEGIEPRDTAFFKALYLLSREYTMEKRSEMAVIKALAACQRHDENQAAIIYGSRHNEQIQEAAKARNKAVITIGMAG